ncbi:MAG: DNA primase [Actinobacteria bacterium]|nr:DNA primase [Actinomycetota bacterium]
MYSEKDIQEIKNRINIVDLASQYTSLKSSGRRLRGLCPFHTEKTPSFYIDPEKQLYHCFGCGAGGDIFDFVMDMEKMSFNEAVEYLADRAGVTLTRISGKPKFSEREEVLKSLERATELYRIYLLKSPEGKKAIEYLLGRNITLSSIKEFEIGLSPSDEKIITKKLISEGFKEKHLIESGIAIKTSHGLIDRFRGRIIFPIRDIKNNVVGFGGRQFLSGDPKYLNTPETNFFKKSSLLYNLNRAKKYIAESNKVIIVEGYTDVIALHQAGIPFVVATLGTALTDIHLNILSRFTENIYLAFDSDAAGQKAAERGIELIPKSTKLNIKVIIVPEGKDPAEFVSHYGREKAREIIEKLILEAETLEDFVLTKRLSEFDITNPKEKRAAAEKVAEILKLIDDPIIREEYIKKYANYLSVEESLLRSKIKQSAWYNINRRSVSNSEHSFNRGKDSIEEAERHFFKLLFSDYEKRVKKATEILKPEYFEDDILKLIFSAIIQDSKKFSNVQLLIDKLRLELGEEAVRNISEIFISESSFEDDERIFDEIIVYLKERFVRKRIAELKMKIFEAESRGDIKTAQSCLVEIQKLAESLRKNS